MIVNQRRKPITENYEHENLGNQSPVSSIPRAEKRPRKRDWEKGNRAYAYTIPRPLHPIAAQIRNDIKGVSQFDEAGNERGDATSVDCVATALMDFALTRVSQNPTLLQAKPNPHSRGQMTVTWEAWNKLKMPIAIPLPKPHVKDRSRCVLSYRWKDTTIENRIRELAGEGVPSDAIRNPFKHAVPIGEVVVRLFQIALTGYKNREFRLSVTTKSLAQHVNGWE